MDSNIDYTQSKKKIQLSNISHSLIPVMYFSTPFSEEYAIDQPSMYMFLCMPVSVKDGQL